MQTFQFLQELNIPKEQISQFINHPLNVQFDKTNQLLVISLSAHRLVSFDSYQIIIGKLKAKFNCDVLLTIACESDNVDYINLIKYIHYIIREYQINERLMGISTRLIDNQFIFLVNNDEESKLVSEQLYLLRQAISEIGIPLTVDYEMIASRKEHVVEVLAPEISFTNTPVVEKRVFKKKVNRNKIESYPLVALHQLVDEVEGVKVKGTIFKIDKRVTRTKNVEVTIFIYHENDAIEGSMFIREDEELEAKVGQSIMMYGDYQYNSYKKENRFRIAQIEVIEDLSKIVDTAPRKRIELHAHTKSSEMDGIADTQELIEQAYHFGHDAIAITDHMVAHSFPSAQRAMNRLNKGDHKIKVLYGVELNMVDDHLKAVNDTLNQDLASATYVVFDLETTGLSSRYDEIIEFGAVKMVDQSVVDSKQFFIKPNSPISSHIENLTGITTAMVANGLTLEEALPEMLDFFGDAILVAHNARFDMRFIQEACLKCHVQPIQNIVIDTLDLSRVLLDLKRSYALGSVARHFKIAYDQNIAHRADYDAQVLSSVLNSLIGECQKQDLKTIDDIYQVSQATPSYDKTMRYHVNVMAKNSEGLKALYELVSLSHTKYLKFNGKSQKKSDESNAEPRIPRHEIDRLRENLLVGSACYNSMLFEVAKTGSMLELEKEVQFYDYIEIQPLDNYRPLLFTKNVKSEEELIKIIKDIIYVAGKYNKLVVATGDVHYIKPQDKVFRDVYINAIGLGGVRHPLYFYDKNTRHNNELPLQHLRTTQEMLECYPYLPKDVVETIVIDNPAKIAASIEEIQPIPKELATPYIEGSDEKLKEICYQNAHQIYGNPLPDLVEKRLIRELNSIISNGYGVIYYTSYLLVKHSLDHGYMVGSRGSVGSSFVATMSEITEVNPLAPHYVCKTCHHHEFFVEGEYSSGYDLPAKDCPNCHTLMIRDGQNIPFETFLGFQGDKVPDIDLNFSGEFQESAHAFTKEIFGESKVLRAGTISTIADKTAFGHVSGFFEEYPEKQTSHLAFKEYLTQGCAGVKRSTGQHPGGIIVIPQDRDTFEFTPYQYPANNRDAAWLTTHFEFNDIHDNLLKLDILGHVDPSAMKYLEDVSGIDVRTIPMNDEKTMTLFSSTEALQIDERRALDKNGAVGLPEFGTSFVRKILDDTKPTRFSDLVRISGLSHGTDVWLGNASELINDGLTLQDVIGCRDDIMTELMQMGLEPITAFNIMESVRKGKGLKPEWIEAMNANNVPSWYIESCLKIKYLFPKAHAVAYCMMGYRVAYFKVHHPLAFYGQYFTLRCDAYEIETMIDGADAILARINDINTRRNSYNIENKVTNKEIQLLSTLEVALEMSLRGYQFTPLNIHTSPATKFLPDPTNPKRLMVPFVALDGLGAGVAESVIEAREDKPFLSVEDITQRTGLNQSSIKGLRKLGALDGMQESNQLSLF